LKSLEVRVVGHENSLVLHCTEQVLRVGRAAQAALLGVKRVVAECDEFGA